MQIYCPIVEKRKKKQKVRKIYVVDPFACEFRLPLLFIHFVWSELNTVGIFININKDT